MPRLRPIGALVAAAVGTVATGCRFGYEPVAADGGPGPPAAADAAAADAAPPAIADPWDGPFTLEPPVRLDALNSPTEDVECFIADDRTLLFTSNRPGLGSQDLYRATRPSPDAPFEAVEPLDQLNTSDAEGRLVLTEDRLTGFFYSDRPGSVGDVDLWMVTRADPAVELASADAVVLDTASGPFHDYDPWPSPDGLRVYFSVLDVSDLASQDIVVVERPAPDEPFGPPTVVEGISSTAREDNPALSADELFVVFGRGDDGRRLLFARRTSRDAPWSTPEELPVVNSDDGEATEPCFDASGELYFSSTRAGGQGGFDLYRSRFVPLD